MDFDDEHSDGRLAASLAARVLEIETKLIDIEAAAESAGRDLPSCERVGIEGTIVAVERISEAATHDRLLAELATVRRAETKLALGSEGRCDVCGEAISSERLEALPWAVRCIDCAG